MQGVVCMVPGHNELRVPGVELGFKSPWPLEENALQSPTATGEYSCTLHFSSQQSQGKTTFGTVGAYGPLVLPI